VDGNVEVTHDLLVSNTLNVGNGIVVDGGATIQGNSSITGDLTVSGNVLPGADNEHDLGDNTLRWRNVYGVNGDFSTLRVSTLTVSGLTPGSVIFAGTGGALSQDNANFFWNNVTKQLGIGTNEPEARLHVVGTGRFDGQLTVTTGGAAITGDLTVDGNVEVTHDLLVSNTLNVGNGIVVDGGATIQGNSSIVGDLSTSGGTVAFSETATLSIDDDGDGDGILTLRLPDGVVVVQIEDGSYAGTNVSLILPMGTQGQLLFIRYSGTKSLTFPFVSPNGSSPTYTGPFHAILMYIGGAWRLMSLVQ
jgi:hypothetical protein